MRNLCYYTLFVAYFNSPLPILKTNLFFYPVIIEYDSPNKHVRPWCWHIAQWPPKTTNNRLQQWRRVFRNQRSTQRRVETNHGKLLYIHQVSSWTGAQTLCALHWLEAWCCGYNVTLTDSKWIIRRSVGVGPACGAPFQRSPPDVISLAVLCYTCRQGR